MAKPAFVGVLCEPAQLPVVCRAFLFAADLPPGWESVVEGLGGCVCVCYVVCYWVLCWEQIRGGHGTGILPGVWGEQVPLLCFGFKCVLEEPSSSVDSSVCKVVA